MKIDAHHHFWNYSEAEYGWIDDSMSRLRRDFLTTDLKQELDATGIDGAVSVQARQTLEETEWLLSLASNADYILGVVGWVDLRATDVRLQLDRFADHRKFKAVRHVVQDEPDDDFLLRADFNQGISLLREYDLAYDILVFERQLPATITFVDQHPEQRFVLDHIAKPQIRSSQLEPWRTQINELANRANVYCKVSGMVTEATVDSWTSAQLLPYWNTVLEAFGPKRLMFGSDWPVCLLGCEYSRWHETVRDFAQELSASEQDALFGGTATAAYLLDTSASEK